MHNNVIRYFEETKAVAEKALKQIEQTNNEEPQINHHVRNSVQALRLVDLRADTELHIVQLCDATWRRLQPYLEIIINGEGSVFDDTIEEIPGDTEVIPASQRRLKA